MVEKIGGISGIARDTREQIKNLAKFPSENPLPVLRIAREGTILYANDAAAALLRQWRRQVGESVSEDWCRLIAKLLDNDHNKITELECENHTLSLVFIPVAGAGYVNIYGHDVTERKRAEREILKLNKKLERRVAERTAKLTRIHKYLLNEVEERKRLEREILDISEREKRLIGQELHDSIGQQFAGVAFMASVLQQRLTVSLPDEAARAAEIAKLIKQAMEQARGLAKGLHPVDLHTNNLASALQELAVTTERLFRIHCDFKCYRPISIDDTTVAIHLYPITQEAITNAIKHAGTKNIQIELACRGGQSVLTVKNDGLDFPEVIEAGTGMGLRIMEHRAEMIDGSLDIRGGDKCGTVVTCVFPSKSTTDNTEKHYGGEKTAR